MGSSTYNHKSNSIIVVSWGLDQSWNWVRHLRASRMPSGAATEIKVTSLPEKAHFQGPYRSVPILLNQRCGNPVGSRLIPQERYINKTRWNRASQIMISTSNHTQKQNNNQCNSFKRGIIYPSLFTLLFSGAVEVSRGFQMVLTHQL